MQILVVGATGMTGRPLVEQLLAKGHKVRVIIRAPEKYSDALLNHENLTIYKASLLDLSDAEMARQVKDCDAVVSCLGHVITLKGMFGHPRKLCTDAVTRLCHAIETNRPSTSVKFILMSSVGVENSAHDSARNCHERAMIFLLRHLLPPHRDNEMAAASLHEIGANNPHIEWCSLRPDTLINAPVSAYEIQKKPTTGLFTGRPTTRSNVAHFMVELIENPDVWSKWKSDTPVIMNANE